MVAIVEDIAVASGRLVALEARRRGPKTDAALLDGCPDGCRPLAEALRRKQRELGLTPFICRLGFTFGALYSIYRGQHRLRQKITDAICREYPELTAAVLAYQDARGGGHRATKRPPHLRFIAVGNVHRVLAGAAQHLRARRKAIANFYRQVEKADGCWLWTGAFQNNGYGSFNSGALRVQGAHCASWVIHFGPIPKGKEVAHSCNNKGCPNPAHLYLATHKENMRDAWRDFGAKMMEAQRRGIAVRRERRQMQRVMQEAATHA